MVHDWGKVKTVEVEYDVYDDDDNRITLTCEVECIEEYPDESDILSATAQTDEETDWLPKLVDWQRNDIIDKAHEAVDWSCPD